MVFEEDACHRLCHRGGAGVESLAVNSALVALVMSRNYYGAQSGSAGNETWTYAREPEPVRSRLILLCRPYRLHIIRFMGVGAIADRKLDEPELEPQECQGLTRRAAA